jgi:hypothetical protein
VTKTSPVEDFNLYKLSYDAREYFIYEGNHPHQSGRLERQLRLPFPGTVRLLRGQGTVEVRFDRGERGAPIAIGENSVPRFIVIWTACPSAQECAIEDVSRLVVPSKGSHNH